jgi:hypothetical protein
MAVLCAGLFTLVAASVARAGSDWEGNPGGRPDCNGNGVLDACDIENCEDAAACDDCNLNDVPDECDIASGTSLDLNLNGVPDECKFFDDEGVDDDWDDPENWDDDDVPNDLEERDDSFVTIAAGPVNMNVHVEVDSCRVLDGSVLILSGAVDEDFEISDSGDLQIASRNGLSSQLLIGEGREVEVDPGSIRVNSGGALTADNGVQFASIEAGNMLIDSRCNQVTGGEVTIGQQVSALTFGDVVVDATQDCLDCSACAGVVSNVAGAKTPPILKVVDAGTLQIGQDLAILGPASFVHTSSQAIEIGGSFINQNPCPDCVKMLGRIKFLPPALPFSGKGPQEFEVFVEDRGDHPAELSPNEILPELIVSEGANVLFHDTFSNTSTGGVEALYVDILKLQLGTQVTVDGCAVYYHKLINKGAKIAILGNGSLQPFVESNAIPAVGAWGVVVLVNAILVAGTIVFQRRRRLTVA